MIAKTFLRFDDASCKVFCKSLYMGRMHLTRIFVSLIWEHASHSDVVIRILTDAAYVSIRAKCQLSGVLHCKWD